MRLYEVLVTSMYVCALHIDPCSPVSTDIVLRSLFEEIIKCAKSVPVCKSRSRLHHSHEAGYGDSSSVLIRHILESERQSGVDVWSLYTVEQNTFRKQLKNRIKNKLRTRKPYKK